jgi:thiol-disulfide isomerase/thioredoxin
MHSTFAIVLIVVALAFSPFASGQDANDESESELLTRLRSGTIKLDETDEALTQLRAAIQKKPSDDWHGSRITLARAFILLQDFDTAIDILKQGFDYHLLELGKSDSDNDLSCMYALAQQIADYASRSSEPEVETDVLDTLISLLRRRVDLTNELDINSRRLSSTIGLRCRTLPQDAAQSLVESEFGRVRKEFEANPDNRFAALAYIDALKALAVPQFVGGKPDINRINELLEFVNGLSEHKDLHKIVWGMEYYDTFLFVIEHILADRPEDAQRFVIVAMATLKSAGENDTSFEQMFDFRIKNLDRINQGIAAAKQQLKIVGTAAPAFDSAAWINGEPTELEKLSGSVVLLDFTAVWCGPCIQHIPDLKMLHEKYSSRGLVIISVTEQYNFKWDEEENGPIKSDEAIELAEEITMLERFFVSKHKIPYRQMVLNKGSKMAESLGGSSIPMTVIIDNSGIVRMIRKGNTRENAMAIQREIEKLLSE